MEQSVLHNIIAETEICNCCESITLSLNSEFGAPNLYYAGAPLEISNNHVWQSWDTNAWVTIETGGFTLINAVDQALVRVRHTELNGCVYYSNVYRIFFP